MITHLTICRHGPLLKIVSKIYYSILVIKRCWTKYDLTTTRELTICVCGPRLIIVSNSCYVLSASKLLNWTVYDYNKAVHLTIGEFGPILIVS